MVYFRLVKGGFASSVTEAATLDVRTVLQAFHYEAFIRDYEDAYVALNNRED